MTATNEQRTLYGKAGSDSFYGKCSRGLMTLVAAGAALLTGGDASPQQYAQQPYAKTPLAYRVQPSQDKPVEQEKPAVKQDENPKQEQQQPRQKLPKERELEGIAAKAYLDGKKLYDEGKAAESVQYFLKARKFYADAEAVEQKDELYAEQRTNIDEWVSVAKYNKNVKDLAPEERTGLARLISDYEKPAEPPKVEPPAEPPKVEKPEVKQEPKPEPKPQDPPKDTVPAEPKDEKKPLPSDVEQWYQNRFGSRGPFDGTVIAGKAGLGPEHRAGTAYLNLGGMGLEVLANYRRDKFELGDDSDLERSHIGIYAEADFNKMFGIPLRAHATGEHFEEILESFSSSTTEDALFRIRTDTDSKTTTTRTFMGLGGELGFGDYGLLLDLYQLEEQIDVDVTTLLDVVNKLDPAGSFTDTIVNSQSFTNTTRGAQAGVKSHMLDNRLGAGLLLTYEDSDMPDFNRDLWRLRWHPFIGYISEDRKWGFYAIGGESLLNDDGERLTEVEYGAVAGMQLGDVSLVGRVSSRERDRTRGMLSLLYCRDRRTLEHLLEQERLTVHSELNLIKHISPNVINEYLGVRDEQILRWVADSDGWKVRLGGGAARVMRDGRIEVVPMYRLDVISPVLWDALAVGFGVEHYEGDESELNRINIYLFPKNKDWKVKFVAEEEKIDGLGTRDRRGLVVWDIIGK